MREVKAKYTKSELSIIAWDSRLKSYNMSLGLKDARQQTKQEPVDREEIITGGVTEIKGAYRLPEGVNNGVSIPKSFFDEEGELDLRKVPGNVGAAYVRSLGIPLAIIPRG